MPHNDPSFTSTEGKDRTHIDNIEDVHFKIVNVAENEPGFDRWFAPNFGDAVSAYVNANFNDRDDLPTWTEFKEGVAATAGLTPEQVEDEFVRGYRFLLFTDEEDRDDIDLGSDPGGDWQLLTDAGVVDADTIRNQFIAAFNHFTGDFPSGDGGVGDEEFKRTFENFMARSALLETSNLSELPEDLTEFFNVELVTSYEEVYDQFFPLKGLSDEERREAFEMILVSFAEERIALEGFFIPTEGFDQWSDFLERAARTSIFSNDTTLVSMGAEKVLILDRIFLLIVRMIDVLQRVAAVQGDRLVFLTEWQKAYTAQIDQIKVFVGDDGTPIDTDDDKDVNARQELNNLNTSFKERLSANRQVISDDAQSMQSAINQSTDAVTQQSNMASAILEQLSTLLTSIFR